MSSPSPWRRRRTARNRSRSSRRRLWAGAHLPARTLKTRRSSSPGTRSTPASRSRGACSSALTLDEVLHVFVERIRVALVFEERNVLLLPAIDGHAHLP